MPETVEAPKGFVLADDAVEQDKNLIHLLDAGHVQEWRNRLAQIEERERVEFFASVLSE